MARILDWRAHVLSSDRAHFFKGKLCGGAASSDEIEAGHWCFDCGDRWLEEFPFDELPDDAVIQSVLARGAAPCDAAFNWPFYSEPGLPDLRGIDVCNAWPDGDLDRLVDAIAATFSSVEIHQDDEQKGVDALVRATWRKGWDDAVHHVGRLLGLSGETLDDIMNAAEWGYTQEKFPKPERYPMLPLPRFDLPALVAIGPPDIHASNEAQFAWKSAMREAIGVPMVDCDDKPMDLADYLAIYAKD